MTITILDKPIETPTEPTTDLNITDDEETCCICQHRVIMASCYYCERPVCYTHWRRMPQWCAFHIDACPECYARKQKEQA
jgi:hypothetical protein